LTASAALAAQQPFKSGASTVVVYATVKDGNGKIITDLARDRFEVYDEGRPQPITTFANDVQPITVVMMLDRSLSMVQNFTLVEQAAESFVDRLESGDKARIGSFSNRVEVDPPDFTSDKQQLRWILQTQLQDPGPTPLWNAMGVAMTSLLHQTGRRVILVFTDGMDKPLNGSSNNLSLKTVSKRADDEDVMVYGIGLVGDPFAGFGGQFSRGGFGPRPRGTPDRPDPGLEKLAAASGGGYFELNDTADLKATFARVADELHHQYLLGFQPAKVDGKSHPLDVRVKGEGLVVRARKSYVSARPS
jgi:VWFA-related protein